MITFISLISLKLHFFSSADDKPIAQRAATSQKNTPAQMKSPIQTPEQYGANGFDQKPDTEAMQKALDNGKELVLKSGATYIIDKPLQASHSLKIRTDQSDPAKIVQKGKTSAFIFDNKPIVSTNVVQNITSQQPFVVLADTKGIKPGSLIHLTSSKLWYWDDRGYLKKGELHQVTRVFGRRVYLDSPIVENYKVGYGENVSATIYPNVSLKMENITFAHPKPYQTIMMRINYTTDATFTNVSVENSKDIGILLNTTFKTKVIHSHVELGTTKDIKKGYGIQDYGGTGTLIENSTFEKVRRGVDFSGSTPSRFGVVRNCRSYGYKKGTLASGNSGFGTHSTAEYITFENNYVENFNYGFLIRGKDITVTRNILKGDSYGFIAVSYGNRAKVMDNTYQSLGGSALETFIMAPDTYKGSINAQGNVADIIKGPFLTGDTRRLKLILKNNHYTSPSRELGAY
ncbi:hypothetical protein [Neobacillus sp. LXY-1]|uniref:hypothetical protein n=1 Tax=Neobacillus sp. LXY-1 TaxID=3379133 RepID=UPI003EDEC1E5